MMYQSLLSQQKATDGGIADIQYVDAVLKAIGMGFHSEEQPVTDMKSAACDTAASYMKYSVSVGQGYGSFPRFKPPLDYPSLRQADANYAISQPINDPGMAPDMLSWNCQVRPDPVGGGYQNNDYSPYNCSCNYYYNAYPPYLYSSYLYGDTSNAGSELFYMSNSNSQRASVEQRANMMPLKKYKLNPEAEEYIPKSLLSGCSPEKKEEFGAAPSLHRCSRSDLLEEEKSSSPISKGMVIPEEPIDSLNQKKCLGRSLISSIVSDISIETSDSIEDKNFNLEEVENLKREPINQAEKLDKEDKVELLSKHEADYQDNNFGNEYEDSREIETENEDSFIKFDFEVLPNTSDEHPSDRVIQQRPPSDEVASEHGDYLGQDDDYDDPDCNCNMFSLQLDGWQFPVGGFLQISHLASNKPSESTRVEGSVNSPNSVNIVAEDYDECLCNLTSANKRWNEEINKDCALSTPLKVKFCDIVKVFPMDEWDRRGKWEEYARDRMRFKRRIDEMEDVLSNVLSIEHRAKMHDKMLHLNNNDKDQ